MTSGIMGGARRSQHLTLDVSVSYLFLISLCEKTENTLKRGR